MHAALHAKRLAKRALFIIRGHAAVTHWSQIGDAEEPHRTTFVARAQLVAPSDDGRAGNAATVALSRGPGLVMVSLDLDCMDVR